MLLMGHEGDIFCTKFHPDGEILVSAGFDRTILVWNVYGECENIAKLTGHHGAIMDLHWSNDGDYLYTASTDKTLGIWDAEYGVKIKKMKGEFKWEVSSISHLIYVSLSVSLYIW